MASMTLPEAMWVGRARTFAFFALALVVVASIGVLAAKPAHAATFTVNSTADDADKSPGDGLCVITSANQCTLRAAIQEANANNNQPTVDLIAFAIPSSGVSTDPHCDVNNRVCTISPTSDLPQITEATAINGYSQTGASANSAPTGTNAVLKIEIDGNLHSLANGLVFEGTDTSNSIIRGLAINDFYSACIILADGTSFKVEGNFIGTDPSGTNGSLASGFPGSEIGVDLLRTSNSTIGGPSPDQRNLISGNGYAGVNIDGSSGNRVEGNLIGTKANGTDALADPPNNTNSQRNGVSIGSSSKSNTIGGVDTDPTDTNNPANTIAFNSEDGVHVFGGTGNRILSNSIFSNGQLGIDLGDDGVTANDGKDADKGANHLQNYPHLLTATATNVTGKLKSTPSTTFTIQFFSSQTADPSGNGEGKTFLGQVQKKTNRRGRVSFSFPGVLPPGENVWSATATNKSTGDTSEFSNAVSAS